MVNGKKVALLVAASLVVFLFVFGSFEYISYTQTKASFSNVEFTGVTFAKPNATTVIQEAVSLWSTFNSPTAETVAEDVLGVIQSVNFNLTFDFHNSGALPVYVLSETHQLFINGLLTGTGSSSGFWVPAGKSIYVSFSESLNGSDLVSLVRSAILSGGQVKFVVVGTASLGVGTFPFSIKGNADLLAYFAQKMGITLPR